MHLEQLKYFAEIIKCGSINKAAQNLFLSPSALSVSLTNLEKELGFKLVERSGRGVKPTELGEAISKEVNEILQMIMIIMCNGKISILTASICNPVFLSASAL